MKLERTLETWAALSPDAAKSLSEGAVYWLAADAQRDIATLAEERDRIERNRDMWKGQVERQAERIAKMREALEPFKSGGDWGKIKAWIINGSPTADGVFAAKRITEAQVAVDAALERLPAPSSTTGEAA